MDGQSLEHPFRIAMASMILLLAAFLCIFYPPIQVSALIIAPALVWVIFSYPNTVLGAFLAFVPIDFMAIALGKFLGLPHMTLVSVLDKEFLLLLLFFILWRKNGFKATAPDWFLLACFVLGVVRTMFSGTLAGLSLDFDFMIPYAVGRVFVLDAKQEALWARCAVWIAAGLSVLGMFEVFVLGEGPRTALYLAIDSETEGGQLTTAFHGVGFLGLREAATMVGPAGFGSLCMIALIVWWVYCRNPVPAAMVGAGLICSVTRNAWLGAAIALSVLAFRMNQTKRLLTYAALALALFVASIPILGLTDYLYYNKTGQDPSATYHQNEIIRGISYDLEHPFGSGNEKVSPDVAKQNTNASFFETTYPTFAAAYGIPALLCFIGFLYSSFRLVLRTRTPLGYTALGILIAMCVVMTFTNSLIDRRLICWSWFPIGLAVRSSVKQDN
jgi:hypothetical protein